MSDLMKNKSLRARRLHAAKMTVAFGFELWRKNRRVDHRPSPVIILIQEEHSMAFDIGQRVISKFYGVGTVTSRVLQGR